MATLFLTMLLLTRNQLIFERREFVTIINNHRITTPQHNHHYYWFNSFALFLSLINIYSRIKCLVCVWYGYLILLWFWFEQDLNWIESSSGFLIYVNWLIVCLFKPILLSWAVLSCWPFIDNSPGELQIRDSRLCHSFFFFLVEWTLCAKFFLFLWAVVLCLDYL